MPAAANIAFGWVGLKYDNRLKRSVEMGRKGGRPKGSGNKKAVKKAIKKGGK
jgi:hypothetical protein